MSGEGKLKSIKEDKMTNSKRITIKDLMEEIKKLELKTEIVDTLKKKNQ